MEVLEAFVIAQSISVLQGLIPPKVSSSPPVEFLPYGLRPTVQRTWALR